MKKKKIAVLIIIQIMNNKINRKKVGINSRILSKNDLIITKFKIKKNLYFLNSFFWATF